MTTFFVQVQQITVGDVDGYTLTTSVSDDLLRRAKRRAGICTVLEEQVVGTILFTTTYNIATSICGQGTGHARHGVVNGGSGHALIDQVDALEIGRTPFKTCTSHVKVCVGTVTAECASRVVNTFPGITACTQCDTAISTHIPVHCWVVRKYIDVVCEGIYAYISKYLWATDGGRIPSRSTITTVVE